MILLSTAQHIKISTQTLEKLLYEVLDFVEVLYEKHQLFHIKTHVLCNKVNILLNQLPKEEKAYDTISMSCLELIRLFAAEKEVDAWPAQSILPEELSEHEYSARRDDVKIFNIALAVNESQKNEQKIKKANGEFYRQKLILFFASIICNLVIL